MRARLCNHLATVCAFAAAIDLVNHWWRMAAGFTLAAVLPLYLGREK